MVAEAVDCVDGGWDCSAGDCGGIRGGMGDAADTADAAAEGGGDAFGAIQQSGGAGPAVAFDEQGRDGDWWRVADSLSGGAD
jgi:hypothetical protein